MLSLFNYVMSTVTGYGLDYKGSIPDRGNDFLHHHVQIQWVLGDSFLVSKVGRTSNWPLFSI
jgi:hypothetical protein